MSLSFAAGLVIHTWDAPVGGARVRIEDVTSVW